MEVDLRHDEIERPRVAREHGITRVRIGFDVTQRLHEFIVLRRVIRDMVEEHHADSAGLEAEPK